MGRTKNTKTETMNPFAEVFNIISYSPVGFRDRVCEECNWSVPTFYRKLRLLLTKRGISNAEKEAILRVLNSYYNGNDSVQGFFFKLKAVRNIVSNKYYGPGWGTSIQTELF